jgi:hypothetical protein
MRLGDLDQGQRYGRERLRVRRSMHDSHGAASSVEFFASAAAATRKTGQVFNPVNRWDGSWGRRPRIRLVPRRAGQGDATPDLPGRAVTVRLRRRSWSA